MKLVEPQLPKKRGKRAGVETQLKSLKSRTVLPGIILTNVQSVLHKLDELHLFVKSRCSYLTQIICITESWLTALTKTQGDGILVSY